MKMVSRKSLKKLSCVRPNVLNKSWQDELDYMVRTSIELHDGFLYLPLRTMLRTAYDRGYNNCKKDLSPTIPND